MSLKDQLNKLIQLQQIDSRIYTLTKKKEEEIPAAKEKISEEFHAKKQALESFKEKVKQLQIKKKDRELDLVSKEESVKKAQAQLYQLKTNKEYQAKLTEIASLKADVSLLEEQVLKALEELEKSEAQYKQEATNLAEEENKFKQEEATIKKEEDDIAVELQTLTDSRVTHSREVESDISEVYGRLLQTRSGLAIAPVNSNNSCGACYIQVTHQRINEIKMYSDLVYCESCLRILYIPEDLSL